MQVHVLIAEDSKTHQRILSSLLDKEKEFSFRLASSLEEVKELLAKEKFTAALLDIHLPDAPHGEVIDIVLEKKIPTILITVDVADETRRKFIHKPIVDYVNKETLEDMEFAVDLLRQVHINKETHVVVADDSPINLTLLVRIARALNFQVHEAENGSQAYDLVVKYNAPLLITDVHMPEMNGIELTRKLRKKYSRKELAILVVSGDEDPVVTSQLLKSGANDYIAKPIQRENLSARIHLNLKNIQLIRELEETNEKLKASNAQVINRDTLLNQYKQAIDMSTIVSKTDTKGRITYANDKFAEISGYTQEELIGKPHNLVRHPDMTKETFSEMWETIRAGKVWSGVVKNQRRDGSTYYVKATVSPIIDEHGEMVEYISIRHDITEIQEVRDYLEKELNISVKNLKEAVLRSEEYEKVISKSNLVTRMDLTGKITFINESLLELLGEKRENVLGLSHRDLVAGENKNLIREIDTAYSEQKEWRGIAKVQRKEDNPVYLESFLLPLRGEGKSAREFIALHHDVTELIELQHDIVATQKEVVLRMGEISESRSKETGNHVKRVAEYSYVLAKAYGLDEAEAELLRDAAPMHDIGKVAIPDAILNKPGRLTDEERVEMEKHAEIGYRVLSGSRREILKAAAIVAYQHHEKWDGSGYPRGLKGEEIHIYGRILAIADVFDALITPRVYKPAWELKDVLQYYSEENGKHFDPKLIDLLMENIDKFTEITSTYKDT